MCWPPRLSWLALWLCLTAAAGLGAEPEAAGPAPAAPLPTAEPAGAGAQEGFAQAIRSAWELARIGRFDEALGVVAECRQHRNSSEQIRKLDAMATVYTMMRDRARRKASSLVDGAPVPVAVPAQPQAGAAPPAMAPRPAPTPGPATPPSTAPAVTTGVLPESAPAATSAPADQSATAEAAAAPPSPTPTADWLRRLRLSPAEAGRWDFAAGLAYPLGGKVEFGSKALTRPDGSQYVNGRHVDGNSFRIEGDPADVTENPSPQLALEGWRPAPGGGYTRTVTFDRCSLHGQNADLDESLGLSLGASRGLGENPFYLSGLTLGFGLFRREAHTTASSDQGISTVTKTGYLQWQKTDSKGQLTVPTLDDPRTPCGPGTDFTMTDNLFDMGGVRTTNVMVDLQAQALIAALSLGAERQAQVMPWLRLSLGAGPTLNVIEFETTLEQSAVWVDPPAGKLDGKPVPNFADSQHDSAFVLRGGAFLTLAARAQLLDRLALDLGLRFDTVFGDAETEQARLDLGLTWAAEFRFVYDL